MKKIILTLFMLISTFSLANDNIYRNYIKSVNPKLSNTEINTIIQSVDKNSKKYDVRKELIYSIMYTESRFNPNEKSNVGAYGIMQIMKELGKTKKCNRYSISDNIRCGVEYLRDNINEFGYSNKSIAGYNMGIYGSKTKDYKDRFWTRFYVNAVLYQMNNLINAEVNGNLVIKPYKTEYNTSPSLYSLMSRIEFNNDKVNMGQQIAQFRFKKTTVPKQDPNRFSTFKITGYIIRRFIREDSQNIKSGFNRVDYSEERK